MFFIRFGLEIENMMPAGWYWRNRAKMWWFGQKNHNVRKSLCVCSIESRKSSEIPIQIETLEQRMRPGVI